MTPDPSLLEPCIAPLGSRIDGFLLGLTVDAQVLYANAAWAERLGRAPADLLGRPLTDLVARSMRPRLERALADVIAGRHVGPLQLHVHGPDDEAIQLDGHLARVHVDRVPLAVAFFAERPAGAAPAPFTVPVDREIALTDRQLAVLQLFASGHTTKQVANALDIAVKTVHNHLTTIYRVLDAQSLVQATMIAARLGLVELGAPGVSSPVPVRSSGAPATPNRLPPR